ncbi:hypothetical protein BZL30_0281 [Mycobacterium kansasii]|uniref:Uncharacterized protein n=1 Tax=Mycobacterium kansasii TaxID=1768 RepID=A0A1V3XU11_MYCKA|nr:hypothetical protein BZL30_0281 [Mycobacterium kansasii]
MDAQVDNQTAARRSTNTVPRYRPRPSRRPGDAWATDSEDTASRCITGGTD